ncbi:alpha-amylase [Leptotrichia sp. HSP-334]|uniref:Alpha-amylase n=1 Tax=Leptotrichia rugosa TaxID=3239302 RepID=A0AB39VEU6_9FUSO
MINGVMIQYFEWNLADDGKHWERLKNDAAHLKEIGVSAVWIPPAYKGTFSGDVGYGAYDLWDLGEFNQKGTVRTKYGTKEELIDAINELHKYGINVYLDAVLNHKGGADETERFLAIEVDPENRNEEISEPKEIEGWTKFTFPGRNKKYSEFEWNYTLFSGVDYDNLTGKTAIYKIAGENKGWAENVDSELGNYDYLMNADVDYSHPEVRNEIINWGKWVINELNLDGFRMDAVKHISEDFIKEFLIEVRKVYGEKFYSVGEYWKDDLDTLKTYLENIGYETDLFDVGLHFNFHKASVEKENYDLTTILDNSVMLMDPIKAVTFVDNHDSQKGSALESEIESWFIPHAYAIILLSEKGYPCLFYGDYYGVGDNKSPHGWVIDKLLYVRRNNAYGEQINYFDDPNIIAFYRKGRENEINTGCVAILSNNEDGEKAIEIGKDRIGQVWEEVTGSGFEDVVIDEEGNAAFRVEGQKIAVWIPKKQ